MSNSRVKSDAEYDMIRSNQRKQNNKSNPFKVTNNANEYFDAITRRHKDDEEYFDNPFEPSDNMMQPSDHMQPSHNYMSNDLPTSNVSNIKQSIASNQSTGNITDDLSNPFETVSVNRGDNINHNMQNYNQMNHQMQDYNNQLYNNQDYNSGHIKAMYAELRQKSLQNMLNTANPELLRDEGPEVLTPRHVVEPDYNLIPDSNPRRTTVNNHYEAPKMPESHEQLTIAQQADKINELINGINQGAIEPELSYEGNFSASMQANPNPSPNSNDKAIMDDIDKELEAMLNESNLEIDADKDDFTSENENLIEEIKRAETNAKGPVKAQPENANGLNNTTENMDEIERTLNEISQNEISQSSGESTEAKDSVSTRAIEPVETMQAIETNTQPENAIDQMISELDNDKVTETVHNTGKMNLSDTLSLALDKNEVMQISKEKMLEEDLGDHKKKKSKIDILINVVLLIMIIVVLGLVAKMILG